MQNAFKFNSPSASAARSSALPPKVEYDFPAHMKEWTRIALVGEAPGADEVRLGHPFVGRSGQLLDKMLQQAGIDRKQSLVANVFRYQPPGNKVDHFFISRRAAAAAHIPIDEELGSFSSKYVQGAFAGEIGHLRDTLKKLSPKVIVALGRTPLWALTGENELLKKVGKTLACRWMEIPVIPTFHPSFILRGNWKLQDDWLKHFALAKDLSK